MGYHIHATDGYIGRAADLIVDDETWQLRYFVVDTGSWLARHQVLIPPHWICDISWPDSEVSVDVTRQAVAESPPYNPEDPINREYETRLYDYYGRPRYWIEGS